MSFIKKMNPGRYIALGFATVILLGAFLLFLPISHREGVDVAFIDALFTSTSAVCVTGLIAIDTY
ncbi:MAG: H(+)-transporting two-sector ATPase, partial [Herbinix sp.]|nr:H(+)-transporting two-sector ATPase [Herbinix sp.]